jgi:hypothetical protein
MALLPEHRVREVRISALYTPLTSNTTFYLPSRDIYISSAYIQATVEGCEKRPASRDRISKTNSYPEKSPFKKERR